MKTNRQPKTIDLIVYGLIFRLVRALGHIPRSMARRIGTVLGDLAFALDRKHRQVVLGNLDHALGDEWPPQKRRRMARKVFHNLGQILFEVGWSLSASKTELNRNIRIDGLENYRAALEKGRGVLFITAHLGNWELLPIVGDRARMALNIVYRPLDFMPLELFFCHLRTRFGGKMIPRRQAMLKIVRALRKKEVIAILLDQSADWYDGVWVDFFGKPTCTNIGAATIALKTGSPVLPAFLYREADGFHAVFGKEIPLVVTGDRQSDIESNTLNYNRAIEKGIRKHPEQWFWVHRRWKSKPYRPWPRIR